ncbi:helix-turn-helix domain-containing protein [Actinacidiphila rubida]|uniref:Helix-turn-helix domain-containing protein n=1 Tax=Actinacidiphila rubida TaxID=310780 RepID=A0A1H8NK16_9ACTN|nr:XRE family transcriptional regulator [Actinacidiphila rubida]SEO29768.1 Helix-turn-helix domain-containing protein [Actinacidiphila rubida]
MRSSNLGTNQAGGQRERARLAAELRFLRERSGLTLAELADKSAYSRSSWQRYLSGAALPPWLAVRALCHLADEPEHRIRALWELAEGAWSGRGIVAPAPDQPDASSPSPSSSPLPASGPERAPEPEPEAEAAAAAAPAAAKPGSGRSLPAPLPDTSGAAATHSRPAGRAHRMRPGSRSGAVAAVLFLTAATGVVVHYDRQAGGRTPSGKPASTASAFHVGCTGAACDGRSPETTLCGVAPQTLLELLPAKGAGLEVRYQPLCRAAWARTWNNRLGDKLTLSEPGAPTQAVTVADSHALYGFTYTPLIALTGGHAALRVCLTTLAPSSTACRSVPVPPSASS